MRLIAALYFLIAAAAWAQSPSTSRFETVEIHIDAGTQTLAAYQVEFWSASGKTKVVGIEGGERPFNDPPHYDPRALQKERVIIAAFTTEPQERRGSIRVATVHLQVFSNTQPDYRVKITTAADSRGRKISAQSTLQRKP